MLFFVINVFALYMTVLSLTQNKCNSCTKCSYFINDNTFGSKLGKCGLFPNIVNSNFIITNDNYKFFEEPDYHYCSVARHFDNMCGKEGKRFKKDLKHYF